MNAGFEALVRYLEENRWKFERHDPENAINLGFAGRNACYRCFASTDESDNLFQFFSFIPLRVPAEKRQEIAELITRANYGLKLGKFEMDFEDGEIRFHTSARYGEGMLHEEVIRDIISVNLFTVDRYFPAFANVLFSNTEPADAVAMIEQSHSGGNHSRWDFAG